MHSQSMSLVFVDLQATEVEERPSEPAIDGQTWWKSSGSSVGFLFGSVLISTFSAELLDRAPAIQPSPTKPWAAIAHKNGRDKVLRRQGPRCSRRYARRRRGGRRRRERRWSWSARATRSRAASSKAIAIITVASTCSCPGDRGIVTRPTVDQHRRHHCLVTFMRTAPIPPETSATQQAKIWHTRTWTVDRRDTCTQRRTVDDLPGDTRIAACCASTPATVDARSRVEMPSGSRSSRVSGEVQITDLRLRLFLAARRSRCSRQGRSSSYEYSKRAGWTGPDASSLLHTRRLPPPPPQPPLLARAVNLAYASTASRRPGRHPSGQHQHPPQLRASLTGLPHHPPHSSSLIINENTTHRNNPRRDRHPRARQTPCRLAHMPPQFARLGIHVTGQLELHGR